MEVDDQWAEVDDLAVWADPTISDLRDGTPKFTINMAHFNGRRVVVGWEEDMTYTVLSPCILYKYLEVAMLAMPLSMPLRIENWKRFIG